VLARCSLRAVQPKLDGRNARAAYAERECVRRVFSQRVSIGAERVYRIMCLRGDMTTGWRDRGTQVRMDVAMSDLTGDETTETRWEV
jgi:hypothetical protein